MKFKEGKRWLPSLKENTYLAYKYTYALKYADAFIYTYAIIYAFIYTHTFITLVSLYYCTRYTHIALFNLI